MQLGLIVTTLGRVDALRKLLDSVEGRLLAGDELIVVAQANINSVEMLVREFRGRGVPVTMVISERGASLGRNVGVAATTQANPLLIFPNDTSWFPARTLEHLRELPHEFEAGGMTFIDQNGPRYQLPRADTPLDRWNVWKVIEAGLLIRKTVFDQLGGLNTDIGTGAKTPWQAGEGTDLLLRYLQEYGSERFAWLPKTVFLMGITEARGLSKAERRQKLRAYGRGVGHLKRVWRYPWWWQTAFIAAGALVGIRSANNYGLLDGWWATIGRAEGVLGHVTRGHISAVTK